MSKYKKKVTLFWAFVVLILLVVFGIFLPQNRNTTNSSKSSVVHIVAGENFWGSIASQIGGPKVAVTSIVSDPNADPHEYESNTATARSFATADYVILNGAGYDSWGDKLLSASSDSHRKILRVADLLGKKEGDNPHFWYNPTYVSQVAAQIEANLITLDPSDKVYFQQQYSKLLNAMAGYQSRIAAIKKQFGGTKVAATEDIFQYLATAADLDLVSPQAFIQAVAEGNDPPTDSVATFQQQLQSGQAKVLVYNAQTVTPLTENMKRLASDQGMPVVGITETIQPPDTTFQDWMNAELINIENALNATALGQ